MKVNIGIDTKTFIRFWLVVMGFVLAGWLIYQASTGIAIVLASVFLAVALNPVVSWISDKLPGSSRKLATAMAYLVVVTILGLLLFLVVPTIISQIAMFMQGLPGLIDGSTESWSALNHFIVQNNLGGYVDEFLASIDGYSSAVAHRVVMGAGSLVMVFVNTFLTLVLTFFMLIEGPQAVEKVLQQLDKNKKTKRVRNVVQRMYKVVTDFVTGRLIVVSIEGVIIALFMVALCLAFGIPLNLVIPITILVCILGLIPMFGATIGAALAAILIAFTSIWAALIFVIFFAIYQQVENNLIVPLVQSKSLELSALAILVAVTIGVYMFGLVGGLLAIPVAGFIKVWIEEYMDVRSAKLKKAASSKTKT